MPVRAGSSQPEAQHENAGEIESRTTTLVAAVLALSGAGANAVPFFWTDWTGGDLDPGPGFSAQGTITTTTSTVGVTYSNANGIGFYQPTGGTDFYISVGAGASPYTSAVVDNRPTGTDIIALSQAGTQTLHFSEAIANPVFAFVSLNGNGYAFDQDFDVLSVGGVDGHACGYWGCGGISKVVVDLGGGKFEYQLNSNNVGGTEPHGTLQFRGAFDTDLAQLDERVLERLHRRRARDGRRGPRHPCGSRTRDRGATRRGARGTGIDEEAPRARLSAPAERSQHSVSTWR